MDGIAGSDLHLRTGRPVVVVDASPLVVERYKQVPALVVERILALLPPTPSRTTGRVFVGPGVLALARQILADIGLEPIRSRASKASIVAVLTSSLGASTTEVSARDETGDHGHDLVDEDRVSRLSYPSAGSLREGIVIYSSNSNFQRLELLTAPVVTAGSRSVEGLVRVLGEICDEKTNVVVSGVVASTHPSNWFQSVHEACQMTRSPLLVDSRSYIHMPHLMPDVLKVTATEASGIFGKALTNSRDIEELLSIYGYPFLAVTAGSMGMYARVDSHGYHLHRPVATVINSSGAGDSAMAVIASFYHTGTSPIDYLRLATLAASQNVESLIEGGLPQMGRNEIDEVAVDELTLSSTTSK